MPCLSSASLTILITCHFLGMFWPSSYSFNRLSWSLPQDPCTKIPQALLPGLFGVPHPSDLTANVTSCLAPSLTTLSDYPPVIICPTSMLYFFTACIIIILFTSLFSLSFWWKKLWSSWSLIQSQNWNGTWWIFMVWVDRHGRELF